MYALLGSLQFELITYFSGLKGKSATKYAKHELVGTQPRLQVMGDELDELTIEVAFNIALCDPAAELRRLQDARRAHEAMPLVYGNGVFVGRFVIESITVTSEQTDGIGNPEQISATVELLEYVEADPLVAQTQRKKAAAPGLKKGKGGQAAKKKPTHTETVRNRDGVEFTKIVRS